MKVLFVGDVHCKQSYVLPFVDKVVKSYNVDKVVFLGDYVDDWYVPNEVLVRELNFQVEWYSKNRNNVQVVNLIGNHDWSYLCKSRTVASGHRYDIERSVKYRLNKLDLKVSDTVSDFLVTHAGVTSQWMSCSGMSSLSSVDEVSRYLNELKYSDVDKINSCSSHRGGTDEFGSMLWADRDEIELDSSLPFSQIVGHTPVSHVSSFVSDNGKVVKFCDTFSSTSSGKAIGNAGVFLVDTDSDVSKQITPEDVDFKSFSKYVTDSFNYNLYASTFL